MKNEQYISLLKIYNISKKHPDSFVPKEKIALKGVSDELLDYLEFSGLILYKRENKTTYYKLTQKGINYIVEHKKSNIVFFFSIVAAVASVVSVVIGII